MVKQLVLTKAGLDVSLNETQLADPRPDEVQVAVRAVGLNPVDAKTAKAGLAQWQWPHVVGLDAAGSITATGNNARQFHEGQRVLWHNSIAADGVLAERVNVPANLLVPLSDEIDDLRAAALPCAGITALQAIDRMQLKPRQTVLIEAGAGGVGYYAIQLAKRKGARVVTTASRPHHQFLGAVGADWLIDYHSQDVAQVIRESVGELDAVLDSLGGDISARDMALLRRGGQYVSLLGLPDFQDADLFTLAPSIHLIGTAGAHARGAEGAKELTSITDRLVTLLAEGELQSPTIERVSFEAEAVSRALERELEGKMAGKQVVILENPA